MAIDSAPTTAVDDELPRWDVDVLFGSLDSDKYREARADWLNTIEQLAALFDRHGIGATTAGVATSGPSQEDGRVLADVIETLNRISEQVRRLGAYVNALVTTDANDSAATAEYSRLSADAARLTSLQTRLNGWIAGHGADALAASSEVAAEHRPWLERCEQSFAHQMSEIEEDLLAELEVPGVEACVTLAGELTSTLEAEVRGESLPVSAVRGMASDDDAGTPPRGLRRRDARVADDRDADGGLPERDQRPRPDRQPPPRLAGSARALPVDEPGDQGDPGGDAGRRAGELPGFPALPAREGDAARPRRPAAVVGHGARRCRAHRAATGRRPRRPCSRRSPPTPRACTISPPGPSASAGSTPGRARANAAAASAWGSVMAASRILMNFDGSFDSAQTLAHELGHAYHNLNLAGRPALLRPTPMALAETASIFCETVMVQSGLASADDDARLALLNVDLVGTTQVVVDIHSRFLFESELYRRRADGPLSVDELCAAMTAAQAATYGDGIDPGTYHPWMWAVKPHYYDVHQHFYNWPYCFGLLFGIGLYARYVADPETFRDDYDDLLSSTGLLDALPLAARFGIDLTDPAFWRASLDVVRERIDAFCALVAGVAPRGRVPRRRLARAERATRRLPASDRSRRGRRRVSLRRAGRGWRHVVTPGVRLALRAPRTRW